MSMATRRRRSYLPSALVTGLALVSIVVLLGVAAPLLTEYGPTRQVPGANLLTPGPAHPLGTDELDRDVLSRVLYGIRTSLTVLVVAVPIGALTGVVVGLAAASNRVLDTVTSRVFDVVLAFPALILAIAVTAVRGPGIVTVMIAISIAEVPVFGRIARGEALRIGGSAYVESSRLVGGSPIWILARHVLPNSLEPLTVQAALSLSLAVFIESGMSFVGVGVRPPQPSLGSVLATAIDNWAANPAYALGPLVAITVLCLGFLLIAQGFGRCRRE